MGNYANKLLFYTNDIRKESNKAQAAEQQADVEDNKMCTPPCPERRTLIDPRSASAGIPRTPIEIKSTPVSTTDKIPSAIPKYLQTKQYLETDMDVVMPPFTPKKRALKLTDSQLSDTDRMQELSTANIKNKKCSKTLTPIDKERYNILGLDPRSPAADFDRTPILVPKSLAKLKARSQENMTRTGSYDTDMFNPKVLYQEINTAYSIPEIQLLPDIDSRHLETLNMEKHKDMPATLQSNFDSTSISRNKTEVTVIKNLKFENAEEHLISSEQKIASAEEKDNMEHDDCEDIEHDIETMHIVEDVSSLHCQQSSQDHSDKIKVWQDLSSSEESESGKEEKEKVEKLLRQPSPREDVIITFDEHTSTALSKLIKTEEDYQKKEELKEKGKKDIRINTKLVSNEDVCVPGNKYATETYKNRTPLGNRSNNGQMQNIATRIVEPQPQQLSKNKTLSGKAHQENTPPYRKHGTSTRNDIQWDPNSTIFI